LEGRIPGSIVEEIRDKSDIIDVISEYLTLKKAGRNFIGLCPFHKEKTPSFTVNRDKQIFYCFGCGEGGNVFSFLMKLNSQSFPEAVRYLAGKRGIVIPEGAVSRGEKERSDIKEQIFRVNQIAARYFSQNLFSQSGKAAREYLKKRGIGETVARNFQLGYAPDGWRYLAGFFEKEKIPLKLAEQAGLVASKADGKSSFYDRFRGRLIFPIEDIGGHIIAFGGRILGNGEPKYLNSPESPVYIKGKCLYGLNKTKDDIRKAGFVIIVEGYFDLLALWNAGVTNVVATLGTALTKEHVDLIRRYSDQAVAVFDPDAAGKKALARSIELFLTGNINAKAVILPDGYDPDQYIRTFGKGAFDEIVANAQSMVDYYIDSVIGKAGSVEEKLKTLHSTLPFIVHIDHAIERNLFIKRISEKLGIDQELLKAEVQRSLNSKTATPSVAAQVQDRGRVDQVELSLIHIMLEYPGKIPAIFQTGILNSLKSDEIIQFAEVLKEAFERNGSGGFDSPMLIDRLRTGMLRETLLGKMVNESPLDEKMADRILADTIKQMKRKDFRERQKSLEMKLSKAQEIGDLGMCNTLMGEIHKLQKEKEALSSRTV
jgi:DNA primase